MMSLFRNNGRCAVWLLLMTAAISRTTLAQISQEAEPAAGLTEIVVTAQKREEKLSETPLSVTAITSATLDDLAATQLRDFATTVPGLSMTSNGVGQTQVNLRGITSGGDISPTVGIYVDEVPYGSSTAFAAGAQLALDVGLFDIDRIEVLRGPQGTLYGASTMGGLIKYVTVMPDTNSFSGTVNSGVSTTHDGGVSYDMASAVNLPLVSGEAGLRISGFYSHDGGFIDNVALGQENVDQSKVYGGRVDLLLTPSDALSIRINGFTQDVERNGSSSADYNFSGQPIYGDLTQHRELEEPFDEQFRLVSATVKYDLGIASLTSISSYQSARSEALSDVSALYVPEFAGAGIDLGAVGLEKDTQTDKITQEVRFAGNGTYIDWLVGGFFTHESSNEFEYLPAYDPGGAPAGINFITVDLPSNYKEYAGFATVTYHVTEKLDVAGGLRYAKNDQQNAQNGSGLLIGSLPQQDSSEDTVTYLANVRYRLNENLMPYVRFATGYQPGGPNIVARGPNGQPLAPTTFAPDTLKSYEVGLKAATPDHLVSIDTALYWINWNDLQVNAIVNNVGIIANASSARSKGAELTIDAIPVQNLTLTGAFSYTDAELTSNSTALGAISGDPLPNIPKFTGAVSADYQYPIAGIETFYGATLRRVSARLASFDGSVTEPQYHLPAYTQTDIRTGVELHHWRIQLYARNLFDSHGQVSANTAYSAFGGPAQVTIIQPRTIGVSASTHF